MSENKHTPEPWRSFNNGQGVVGVSTDRSDVCWTRIEEGGWLDSDRTIDIDYENARRIVACVNACAGCATEVLETAPVGFFNSTYGHPKYLEEITKQRDALLAALEHFATWGRMQHKAQSKGCHATFDMMALKDEIDLAEAAIASVKGEQ